MDQTRSKFFDWLDRRLRDKGWNDLRLAQEAHVSHALISLARSGERDLGPGALIAIARALDVPPEVPLRKAHLLPDGRMPPVNVQEMAYVFGCLGEADQEDLLLLARVKFERRKWRGRKGRQ